MSYDSEQASLRWKGTWVSGAPGEEIEEEEFAKSENTFECESAFPLGDVVLAGGEGSLLEALSGGNIDFSSSSYLLDQDDGHGLRQFSDTEHTVVFDEVLPEHNAQFNCNFSFSALLAASCKKEFGSFVSFGYTEPDESTGKSAASISLTIARKYIDEMEDSRVKWNSRMVLMKGRSQLKPGCGRISMRDIETAVPWRVIRKIPRSDPE